MTKPWFAGSRKTEVFLLPILSGLIYWLSSQAFFLQLAVWLCLVPLGFSFYKASPGKGLAAGFIYGFLFWLLGAWWVSIQLINMVGLPPWQAWCWTMAFCAFNAIPYALFGFLAGKFRLLESDRGVWLAAAALAVLQIWFPHLFPGNEAHNLYGWPLFLQVLDLGGVPLLLFFVYLVNFQIVRVFTARNSQGSPWTALFSMTVVFVLLAGYGAYRLQALHQEMKIAGPRQKVTVLSIQPNIPVGMGQLSDVPAEDRGNDISTALSLSRRASLSHSGAELIVWPETPFFYDCQTQVGRDIVPLAKETGKAVLVPCTSKRGKKGESRFYSDAILIGKDGSPGEQYRKLILVPFGEYLPLEHRFPLLRRLFPGVMTYAPGKGVVLYDLGQGRRVIPSLCYEAIFTEHSRRFVARGGNILINMVDDAWFGKSAAAVRHMSLVLFRAVEYRIPVVQVTNSGVGVFVQPTGEIVPGSWTPLFRKAASAHGLYIPPVRSPYEQWGDAFLYGLTGLVAFGLAMSWPRTAVRGSKRQV